MLFDRPVKQAVDDLAVPVGGLGFQAPAFDVGGNKIRYIGGRDLFEVTDLDCHNLESPVLAGLRGPFHCPQARLSAVDLQRRADGTEHLAQVVHIGLRTLGRLGHAGGWYEIDPFTLAFKADEVDSEQKNGVMYFRGHFDVLGKQFHFSVDVQAQTFQANCMGTFDDSGMNVVKELAGHSDIATTNRFYSNVDEYHLAAAARVTDELLASEPDATDPKLTFSGNLAEQR